MEIEATPRITKDYASGPMQFVISATRIGKTTDEKLSEFMANAEKGIQEMIQRIAEIAFNKGREYERLNGVSHD